ncbi:MAG: hypothetical protein EBV03_02750 [Proteobacteria bacterium]|nr:hypothetical protein [Pseudomonadota bacterium]
MAPSRALLAVLLLAAMPAGAAEPDTLQAATEEMREAQTRHDTLDARHEQLTQELEGLQSQLVGLAEHLRATEAENAASEEKLRILTEQIKTRDAGLKSEQKRLNALVRAAISLSHTPAEAMVMMPGDVTQTMKAARTLKMASASVRELTQALAVQLQELGQMRQKVAEGKNRLAAQQQALQHEQASLQAKLEDRQKLLRQLGQERAQLQARLGKLAKKTKDMQELLGAIEKEHKEAEPAMPPPPPKIAGGRSFESARGHIRSPAAGKLVQHYGSQQGKNATSRGVMLKTRANSPVLAPFDGEAVFTGPFLNYGDMVIIRHEGGFHTLLAGLQQIDVEVGQFLLEGEPIGAMGEGEAETRLYIELRKNNQPVDPARWISLK